MSEWLKSTTEETTGTGKDVEKKEPSCTIGGNVNWCTTMENSMEFLQKVKNSPVIALLGIYPKDTKIKIRRGMCT